MKDTRPNELQTRGERRKVRKFWHLLSNRPFVTVVFNEDGTTSIYHKGLTDPVGDLQASLKELA